MVRSIGSSRSTSPSRAGPYGSGCARARPPASRRGPAPSSRSSVLVSPNERARRVGGRVWQISTPLTTCRADRRDRDVVRHLVPARTLLLNGGLAEKAEHGGGVLPHCELRWSPPHCRSSSSCRGVADAVEVMRSDTATSVGPKAILASGLAQSGRYAGDFWRRLSMMI